MYVYPSLWLNHLWHKYTFTVYGGSLLIVQLYSLYMCVVWGPSVSGLHHKSCVYTMHVFKVIGQSVMQILLL